MPLKKKKTRKSKWENTQDSIALEIFTQHLPQAINLHAKEREAPAILCDLFQASSRWLAKPGCVTSCPALTSRQPSLPWQAVRPSVHLHCDHSYKGSYKIAIGIQMSSQWKCLRPITIPEITPSCSKEPLRERETQFLLHFGHRGLGAKPEPAIVHEPLPLMAVFHTLYYYFKSGLWGRKNNSFDSIYIWMEECVQVLEMNF